MKRFFLSILLLSGVVAGFVACNNGPYNADPSGNVSTAANPVYQAPGSGQVVGKCVCKTPMSADIDGNEWVTFDSLTSFHDSTYNGADYATLTGADQAFFGHYSLVLYIGSYHGVGTYNLGYGGSGLGEMIDGANVTSPYVSNNSNGKGNGTLVVTSDGGKGGTVEGNFSYTAFTVDGSKSHVITGGYFKVKHQ